MRCLFGFLCVCALGLMPLVGCSETAGDGGSGGTAGSGGSGGSAGGGGSAGDGGSIGDVFPCTEQGILDAIALGDGPHYFDCDGTAPVVTQAEIKIDSDVILDGEGKLTVDGNKDHRVFSVPGGVTAELRGFGVVGGVAIDGVGGGISNAGTLHLVGSIVSENEATAECGPLCGAGWGGGIHNTGALTLHDTTVSGNAAALSGGGTSNFGTMALENSTVSGNTAGTTEHYVDSGGGIENRGTLTLSGSIVSGNTAGHGGGLSTSEGTTTLTNSTVSGNTADRGGGINIEGSPFDHGPTVALTNSTVSGNIALNAGNPSDTADHGGGIRLLFSWLAMTNSTVSGNTADKTGGGIDSYFGKGMLTNITVSGNAGGAIRAKQQAPNYALTLTKSLVDGRCDLEDILGSPAMSNGYNIGSPGDTCGFDQGTDQFDVSAEDLNLGELANNSGPTMTHKPGDGGFGEGSAAIDKIPADACNVTTDQRGLPRPETGGTMCDVGSVEVQPEL